MADIIDPFETKSSSNIKDPFEKSVPTTEPIDTSTRTERNLGRAGAFATGLGAGILGAPGEAIEAVQKAGTSPSESNFRKTFEILSTLPAKFATKDIKLPTTSTLEKAIAPKLTEKYSDYTTAGELAPAIVGGTSLLYQGGKYAASKLPKLLGTDIFSLRGQEKAASKALQEKLGGKAEQESKLANVATTLASTEAKTAETAAEKALRQQELAKREIPGFKTEKEAGRFKPIGQTVANIGDRIKTSADQVYSSLKARRDANAQKLKTQAFADALNKEKAGARVTDTQAFEDAQELIKNTLVNPDTKLANTTVSEIKEQLLKVKRFLNPRELDPATGIVTGRPASFESLDQLRRFLRDRANGLPAVGYDAISQQQAGKLASSVEKIMTEFSPGFERFIAQYAADSQPMRVFQSRAGKSMIDEQLFGKGANYATTSSEAVANNVFKNKENFNALIDAFGGNKQLAQAEARKFFGSQLEARGTAKEVESFIRQNREMLRETGALKDAENYAINVRKFENRTRAANEIAKARQLTVNQKSALESDMATFETQLRGANKDQLPGVAKTFADNLVKKGLIDQKTYGDMIAEINQLKNYGEDITTAVSRLRKTLYVGLVGGVGSYGSYKVAQQTTGI
jgi:hypothetical protein